MALKLRALTVLSEDPRVVASTHVRQLTSACNSRSWDLMPLASLRYLNSGTHIHMYIHTLKYNEKVIKIKGRLKRKCN